MTKGKSESFSLAGRGILGGLVSKTTASPVEIENAAEWIATSKIVPSPFQPRQFFSQSSIDSLAKSFEKQGFKGAVNVRPLENGIYELVAGERRWRAAQQAGMQKIRCIVDSYTNEEALEFALVENMQREDLSKLEETEGILHFIEARFGIPRERAIEIVRTEGHSDKVARSDVAPSDDLKKIEELLSIFNVGLQTFRTKNLRTLSLPEDVKKAHLEQNLPYSSAIELSKVKDESNRKKLLSESLQEELSFRQIKDKVRQIASSSKSSTASENSTLAKRLDRIAKQAKRSESTIGKGRKGKRIEKLLNELESLLSEE